jgi:hypothetical protein
MAEELRLFVRVSLYVLGAGVVYWFVSYEWAGTVLLAALLLAGAFITIVLAATVAAARRPVPGGLLSRVVGFAEHPDEQQPLEIHSVPVATASIWPVVGGVAFLLVGLGLVFGAWFYLPGAVMGAACAWGWMTELTD